MQNILEYSDKLSENIIYYGLIIINIIHYIWHSQEKC